MLQLVNTLHGLVVVVLVNVDLALLCLLLLPILIKLCTRRLVRPRRQKQRVLYLNVAQRVKYLAQEFVSLVLRVEFR